MRGGPPRNVANRRGLLSGHGALGTAFLISILAHCPEGRTQAIAATSIALLVVGALVKSPATLPIKARHDHTRTIPGSNPGTEGKAIACSLDNAKITDGQTCYFGVNGRFIRVAWTRESRWRGASSHFTLVTNLTMEGELSITGPFFGPLSRYVRAPKSVIILCTDSTFPEAHSLLHARQESEQGLTTKIYWSGASRCLHQSFIDEHQCDYSHLIKAVYFHAQTAAQGGSWRSLVKTVQVNQPGIQPFHSQRVSLDTVANVVAMYADRTNYNGPIGGSQRDAHDIDPQV